ncbi:MAG: LruC domain-containing protein [Planctomycetota bacterium]
MRSTTWGGLVAAFLVSSCSGGGSGGSDDGNILMNDVDVPVAFTFETSSDLSVFVVDAARADNVRIQIYAIDEESLEEIDELEQPNPIDDEDDPGAGEEVEEYDQPETGLQLIAQGFPNENGVFETKIRRPSYVENFFIVRGEAGSYTTATVAPEGTDLSYTFPETARVPQAARSTVAETNVGDFLYAVNGRGEFYSIDLQTNNSTELINLPFGSIACALDRVNNIMYVANKSSPYELMTYDPTTDEFTLVSNLSFGFPRMEYNPADGLLYIGKNDWFYVLDPPTGTILASYRIFGMQNPKSGGDLVLAEDGTWYMTAFSGLYSLTFEEDSATATRISSDNLPFNPTSLALDEDQETAYMCTNEGNSRFVAMSVQDGAFEILNTFSHKVNDLTQFYVDDTEFATTDTDGDGVVDDYDDFPDDADYAFENYTPSVFGWGTLGFEDLWPDEGDYDFNDLVVNYRINRVADANNDIVELRCLFRVKAVGAEFINGFGMQLPLDPEFIQSVTGSQVTRGAVSLDSKGLEQGHTGESVVIVFDAANDQVDDGIDDIMNTVTGSIHYEPVDINVTITFTTPIDPEDLGTPPFNPFLFRTADRDSEVHLRGQEPTDLANTNLFGTGDDDSVPANGRYYVNDRNLPWAINIIHDFAYPEERSALIEAFNNFETWAESGATQFRDWYKDNSGYRNTNRIYRR